MNTTVQRSMLHRMLGAAMLDIDVYEDVEADTHATAQAAGVVAIVAIASAIGGIGGGAAAAVSGLASALIGWSLWALITYLIGDKLLGGTATWGELLRTLGFAQAPGLLFVLGVIPGVGGELLKLGIGIWLLFTGVVAIRQALDFGTGRALLTAALGLAVYIGFGVLLDSA